MNETENTIQPTNVRHRAEIWKNIKSLSKPVLILIIFAAILLVGGSAYAASGYYQSTKLIKQADELKLKGQYVEAITKYDQALQKWKWSQKKINPKKAEAKNLKVEDQNFKYGEANFGAGEWQKCMEYMGKVDTKYPHYETSKIRYSDCQKKLDEQVTAKKAAEEAAAKKVAEEQAAVKKAADDAAIAKAAADAAAKKAADEAVAAAAAAAAKKTAKVTPTVEKTKAWRKGSDIVLAGAYADSDIVDLGNGQYRMYYAAESETSNFHGQIYSAVSSDGINWTPEDGERKSSMTFPDVIKLQDGRWRMYFQDHDHVIKSAVSGDGLNFTDEDGIRIDRGESGYTIDEIGGQGTMILSDGTYLMVYSGQDYEHSYSDKVPNNKTANFFYATSSDGLTWQKRGLAVDSNNSTLEGWVDGADLINFDGQPRLYFWGYQGIYYANYTSSRFSKPVFTFSPSVFDPSRVYPLLGASDPTLLKINNKWFMYYGRHISGIYYTTLE